MGQQVQLKIGLTVPQTHFTQIFGSTVNQAPLKASAGRHKLTLPVMRMPSQIKPPNNDIFKGLSCKFMLEMICPPLPTASHHIKATIGGLQWFHLNPPLLQAGCPSPIRPQPRPTPAT